MYLPCLDLKWMEREVNYMCYICIRKGRGREGRGKEKLLLL